MSARKRALPVGWYPSSGEECNFEMDAFLKGFNPPQGLWRGGVVPHAGWYFSGRAAARVISTIAASTQPDRVVIYGGHLTSGHPIIYTDSEWETPLGTLTLDSSFAEELVSARDAVRAGRSFSDNTVEIQLPMIQRFFPGVPVIAVHSPASDGALLLGTAVQALLNELGLSAVYIGSADLTHYGPNYGFVPKGSGASAVQWVKEENDRSLIDKALAMEAQAIIQDARLKHNTCSAGPIASVVTSVLRHGVKKGNLLEYYTSYDVMPNASFVGYAAILY
ncbi:MAG: AmmeMemoRadiSam system protein B [Desulfomonile tiedjei]|uniref:AmmeMemoRadiSam system protein B n=1 Tax=Desulfomonile tiedjei TaxID=2358 RepID=A0A9D6YZ41_9BACT|nr:AmmeMemoRadiSam system protein B [Desulfomonile tiedjei]